MQPLCSGKSIIGHRNFLRRKLYEYYGCYRKYEGCSQRQVNKKKLEDAVIEHVQELIMSPEAQKLIIQAMNEEFAKQQKNTSSVLKAKKKVKAGLETKLENLYKLVEDGICDSRTIERLKNLQVQIAEVEEEINKASSPISILTPEEIRGLFIMLEEKIKNNDDIDKKIMIDTFVDRITITGNEVALTMGLGNIPSGTMDKHFPNLKLETVIFLDK